MELFQDSSLADIMAKVESGVRLNRVDGIRLLQSKEILAIGYMANLVRRRLHGDKVYFVVNRHINYTNVCTNLCKFCAFGKPAGDAAAYTLTLDEIETKIAAIPQDGIREVHEVHIVGGLNPDLDLAYFEAMLRRIKGHLPGVCIQGFTAVEIEDLARRSSLSVQDVLARLKKAGLDSLPGGGAEIFAPRVRRELCERKLNGKGWLEVHATAHGMGIPTNATMLYGHIETVEERVDHLLALRDLQDRTGGFQAFIPLPFFSQNTGLAQRGIPETTGYEDLKMLAVARLLLDNIPHIKAFWIMLGPKLAQISLGFGVDDLDGTVVEEQITHAAGATTAQGITREEIIDFIKAAGCFPVERDSLYHVIREGF